MSTTPISPQLRQLPKLPNSPWRLSPTVLKRIPQDSSNRFQKWELLPTDPETAFVTNSFLHSKPHKYAIAKIFCIQNPYHLQGFEVELVNSDDEAQKFLPRWSEEGESRAKSLEHLPTKLWAKSSYCEKCPRLDCSYAK